MTRIIATLAPGDTVYEEVARFPVLEGYAHAGQIVWTGSAFASVHAVEPEPWADDTLMLGIVDGEGDVIVDGEMEMEPEFYSVHEIIWTGSEITVGVSSYDGWDTQSWMVRLTPGGEMIGEPFDMRGHLLQTWTGSEFVVATTSDDDGAWQVSMNRIGFCE